MRFFKPNEYYCVLYKNQEQRQRQKQNIIKN